MGKPSRIIARLWARCSCVFALATLPGCKVDHTVAGPGDSGSTRPVDVEHRVSGGERDEPIGVKLIAPEQMTHKVDVTIGLGNPTSSSGAGLSGLLAAIDTASARWDHRVLERSLELLVISGLGIPSWAHARFDYLLPTTQAEIQSPQSADSGDGQCTCVGQSNLDPQGVDNQRAKAWGLIYWKALRRAKAADDHLLEGRLLRIEAQKRKLSIQGLEAARDSVVRRLVECSSHPLIADLESLGQLVSILLSNRVGSTAQPIWLDAVLDWPKAGDASPSEEQARTTSGSRDESPRISVLGVDGIYGDVEQAVYSLGSVLDESEGTVFRFWTKKGESKPLEEIFLGTTLEVELEHQAAFASGSENLDLDLETTDRLLLELRALPRPDGSWRIGGCMRLLDLAAFDDREAHTGSNEQPYWNPSIAHVVLVPWERPR